VEGRWLGGVLVRVYTYTLGSPPILSAAGRKHRNKTSTGLSLPRRKRNEMRVRGGSL
jgi:hypothetical protein